MIRTARSLILQVEHSGIIAQNFLTQDNVPIAGLGLAIVTSAYTWSSSAYIISRLANIAQSWEIASEIRRLLYYGILVAAGTPTAVDDLAYEERWAWGITAGAYHFGIKNPVYATPSETHRWLSCRADNVAAIPLYTSNDCYSPIVRLPKPDIRRSVVDVMYRRRSFRGFGRDSISLEMLGKCLFSGLGITAFAATPIPGYEAVPLKMTPSAGGRNPFEAYVFAKKIESLQAGFYHYSAIDNSLGFVCHVHDITPGQLVGQQPWFDDAGAVIILVANFARTMWKYPHPTGFRVVLIEAGHIAQNILLTATELGLASAPTSAVSDSVIESFLGTDPISCAAIYTVAIGSKSPVPTEADVQHSTPNPYIFGVHSRS